MITDRKKMQALLLSGATAYCTFRQCDGNIITTLVINHMDYLRHTIMTMGEFIEGWECKN